MRRQNSGTGLYFAPGMALGGLGGVGWHQVLSRPRKRRYGP